MSQACMYQPGQDISSMHTREKEHDFPGKKKKKNEFSSALVSSLLPNPHIADTISNPLNSPRLRTNQAFKIPLGKNIFLAY
ncbi:Uncharacterized protein TCM_042669 [Theobroma cacao]|uniref:Uncharacterized protein n=1 Tax=Theobroma cacao TaxID=3641 RepID=A0A061FLL4_THECC|nr:Uncharacterized protein TCM_042669 [Theobroma cacao]